ncbi:MAG: NFACT family protein, partial [Clostridia bacterium]|nr:NFACT family protein [Clostridia bacterium]
MFDAGMLRAIIYEINCFIREGAKVEKVYQPLKDEIDLVLRSAGENRRLCINAGSNAPRLSFSDSAKENPPAAPMFCMLLRKHLSGARLVMAEQIGFERVAKLSFCGFDEMGYETKRYLIAEIMGKYSNLILLDENEKIISALKIIDFSTSRLRQILPTMKYELPPAQDKKNPLEETEKGFFESLSAFPSERTAEKFISLTYLGISSSLAREIAFRATKNTDTLVENTDKNALCHSFFEVVNSLKRDDYTPTIVYDNDGAPLDYFFLPVKSYDGVGSVEEASSFGQLLDKFFGERDRRERIKQRATDILQLLNNAESRLSKKIALQREELAECEKGEEYK